MSTTLDLAWYQQLVVGGSAAGVVGVVCVVSALGIAIGTIRVRGIVLGVAGVLFASIAYAHFFWNDDFFRSLLIQTHGSTPAAEAVASALEPIRRARRETLEFLRDFGLVLFVYSVGMQIGPNFFASLRAQGLRWNLLAAANIWLGFLAAWIVLRAGGVHPAVVIGVLTGAVTNTPSLAAAQQTIKSIPGLNPAHINSPGIGYAVAYPFGVLGTILSMLLVRVVFRINVAHEARTCKQSQYGRTATTALVGFVKSLGAAAFHYRDDLVTPPAEPILAGRCIRGGLTFGHPTELDPQRASISFATSDERESVKVAIGEAMARQMFRDPDATKRFATKRLIVTDHAVVGKTLGALNFRESHAVEVVRILRGDIEVEPTSTYDLHFGDTLVAVGHAGGLRAVERIVGNSSKKLDTPQLAPMFVTIIAGVLFGSIPWPISSLPVPVKLGLAGGPLVAALFFSSIGHIGRWSFYLPRGVNTMLRELGLVLFLSAVGLTAGGQFVRTLLQGDGCYWMACGAFITLVPLVTVATFARRVLKVNYASLCGIMAGSMTDAPALAFASGMTQSDGPAVAYGTVYPVTQILRILSAQLFVILFAGPPF